MMETSRLFKDLPTKPLDTAVWWTEYVLRNGDTSFLKPLGIHQTWYERRLLDVWAFILTTLIITVISMIYAATKCTRRMMRPSESVQKKKVKRS